MSVIEKTITFFRKTLGQDVITLSLKSGQASVEALDSFVVRAAAEGLLVEVWIDDERRNYEFGDYVELIKNHGFDLPEEGEVLAHKTVLGGGEGTSKSKKAWNTRVVLQDDLDLTKHVGNDDDEPKG